MLQVVLGLGNSPDEMKQTYLFSCLFYGMFMYLLFGLSMYYVMTQESDVLGLPSYVIRIATAGSVLCYFLAAALHGEFSAIALTFFQYMFMLPTYMNIFAIYSFCNIHDISWGTKGNDDIGSVADGHGVGIDTSAGASAGLDHEQLTANRKQQQLMIEAAKRENV